MPPVKSSLPASDRHIAVMGKSVGIKVTASFVRVSQIYSGRQLHSMKKMEQHTYPYVAIVGAAHEHLLAALTNVHAIDHLLVPRVPPYPLARLDIPTC